jgi:hypothetical protein
MNPMMAAQVQPPAQMLKQLALDAQKVAAVLPEAAPLMRQVGDLANQALLKMIQTKAAQVQQAPQI